MEILQARILEWVAMPSSKSTILQLKKKKAETSLVIQKFRLWASNAKGARLISGQETKSTHAMQYNQKIKKKKKKPVYMGVR